MQEKFRGVALHSDEYKSSKGFEGHTGIVVGSANTAHDIAEDMLEMRDKAQQPSKVPRFIVHTISTDDDLAQAAIRKVSIGYWIPSGEYFQASQE